MTFRQKDCIFVKHLVTIIKTKKMNNAQYFFVVVTPDNGAVFMATKYHGPTNSRGSRLSYWQMNCAGEIIGKKKTVSWNHAAPTNQEGQLRAALGEGYRVLSQWETLRAIERAPRFAVGDYVAIYTEPERYGDVTEVRYSDSKEFAHAYKLKYRDGSESHWTDEKNLLPYR